MAMITTSLDNTVWFPTQRMLIVIMNELRTMNEYKGTVVRVQGRTRAVEFESVSALDRHHSTLPTVRDGSQDGAFTIMARNIMKEIDPKSIEGAHTGYRLWKFHNCEEKIWVTLVSGNDAKLVPTTDYFMGLPSYGL